VDCSLVLSDLRDVTAAVQRCRRLLDLDADPLAISGYFGADPVIGPLAAACPGRRSIGAVDGDEIAVRAVLGQQVSVAAGRPLAELVTRLCGTPLPTDLAGGLADGLTHVFPSAAAIAALDPAVLPMPGARARALVGLAGALAAGDIPLDPGADRDAATARLVCLPGVGPWTAGYIRMRALSDPDVFLPGDVGVQRALARLGRLEPGGLGNDGLATRGPARPGAELTGLAEGWRPWRSYAVHQLWATLEAGVPAPSPAGSQAAGRQAAGRRAAAGRPAATQPAAALVPAVPDSSVNEGVLS
jgi:AraC family transcriptional regulator, regulatory protein of adaptative response / DNA-3-methyladenine glycosylase II